MNKYLFKIIKLLCLFFLLSSCNHPISNTTEKSTCKKPKVSSYYYTWYNQDKWKNEATTSKPLLDYYNSEDKKIIKKHVEWAKYSDIDFLSVAWFGKNHHATSSVIPSLFREASRQNLTVSILYDSAIALNQSPDRIDFDAKYDNSKTVGDKFIEDLNYIVKEYYNFPSTTRYKSCPLINFYLVRNFTNHEKYFEKISTSLKDNHKCLSFVADILWWGTSDFPLVHNKNSTEDQWKWLSENFSGFTGYNLYSHNLSFYGLQQKDARILSESIYLDRLYNEYLKWEKNAKKYNIIFHPNLIPGYDDRPLRGGQRPALHPSNNFYNQHWKMVNKLIYSAEQIIYITSFNEWHEGTQIEPNTEVGNIYLEATKNQIQQLCKS
jgi:Glycosyl hydrolase family 99